MKHHTIFYLMLFLLTLTIAPCTSSALVPQRCVNGKHFIYSRYYGGRLGNQLFQIAAALSLAIDHNAEAVFPDYLLRNQYDIPINREMIFPHLNFEQPRAGVEYQYVENRDFKYSPIPYRPNMRILGYFQSEKFFKHNKDKILPYFEPSDKITSYLQSKYDDLLCHPCTVAIHLRGYLQESPNLKEMFPFIGQDYVEQAASLFPEHALFVIFTDQIEWAKHELKDFSRPHVFIENEMHYHDFFLMSFLKHQIICNSSFGWWAAYLNKNPDKIVVAPFPWFHPNHHLSSEHIIPDEWIKIHVDVE